MKLVIAISFTVLIAILVEVSFFSDITDSDYSLKTTDSSIIIPQINRASVPFIENHGQVDESIKYYAKTFAGTVYVTDSDLIYNSKRDATEAIVIKEKFLGAILQPTGTEKSSTIVNYFKGNQENWKTNILTYDDISLGTIWPNIDVTLKAHGNNVEKIFIVGVGGRVSDIKMKFDGISSLSLSEDKELILITDLGHILLSDPIAYQYIDNMRHDVSVHYDIIDSNTYGFSVLSYDPEYELVIDPLIAATFIGASGGDDSYGIARDGSGNIYITGETDDVTTDFPTTAGAYRTSNNGTTDAFVSKFNSALTTLSASTLIGAGASDRGGAIAIDSSGNVYISGFTANSGPNFPTTAGAYNGTHAGGTDVFISKFNSALTTLSASTLIGGSGDDAPIAIAIDSSGNVYITGYTYDAANDFPTTAGAYNGTHAGGTDDAFVSKFNSALTTLSASTLIGSSSTDGGNNIVLDSSGNVYITGHTAGGFPTTMSAYDGTNNGNEDAFVSKFNSALTTLSASTLIGGSGNDYGNGVVVDSSGNIYITGNTAGGGFPTTSAYNSTYGGGEDAFVSKFNSALTTLSASTFVGGSGEESGLDMILDSSGNVYITGYTVDAANDFPTTTSAYNTTHNGNEDAFVSKFNSALTTLSASTLIGGSGDDLGYEILLDNSNNVYITGHTYNSTKNFPTTTNAYDKIHNGNKDAFVLILDCNLSASGSSCGTVSSGGSTSVPVSAGGTARATLPAGNVLNVTLPSGVSGTITFTDTNSGNSSPNISFFGNIVNIEPSNGASCSGGCTISFTFTGAQASTAGITPSQAVILHDSNENGNFESNESVVTTVTGSDPYTATGSASFTSKFAVGGIRANAVASAQSLSTGGFFDFLSSCDPDGFASGQSLKIYEISYDRCENNKLQVVAYSTCGPLKAEVTTNSGRYTLGMPSAQPFFNDAEKKIILAAEIDSSLESFNILIKDKRDSFTDKIILDQCSAVKTYLDHTGYTSEQQSPFSYGSYSSVEETKQQSTESIDPEPTQIKQNNVMADPEPTQIHKDIVSSERDVVQSILVDPEPTQVEQNTMLIDPEPSDKNPKNGFMDMLIRTFSKIFRR